MPLRRVLAYRAGHARCEGAGSRDQLSLGERTGYTATIGQPPALKR